MLKKTKRPEELRAAPKLDKKKDGCEDNTSLSSGAKSCGLLLHIDLALDHHIIISSYKLTWGTSSLIGSQEHQE